MYTYRVDKGTTKKVEDLIDNSSNKMSQLIDEINKYNKVFSSTDFDSMPSEAVKYDRLENISIDPEKIASQAESELTDYKDTNINKIISETKDETDKLNESKISIQNNFKDAKNNLDNAYASAKEDASNDALKRGLSRSSIVINVLDAFDKEKLNQYNKLNEELTSKLNNIDSQLLELNAKQKDALEDFDIQYAVKLQDKINTLTTELTEKQNEILKYNNEIAEKENEYNKKYSEMLQDMQDKSWDKEKDLIELANKYGYDSIVKFKNSQIIDKAKEFFKSYDKSEIIYELKNNKELINTLGTDVVNNLINYYENN